MKISYIVFLFTVIYLAPVHNYAFPKTTKVDSINNLLNGNYVFDDNYDYPILKSYTFKNDSPLTKQINLLINEAQKAHNTIKEFKGYFVLGQFYLHKHNYPQANLFFLKAQKKAKNKKEFVAVTQKLADTKIGNNKYLEALEYYRQIKDRIINQGNAKLIASIYLKEGFCYTQINNFEIADEYLTTAFAIIESESLKELYGEYFMYKGLFFYHQFNYLNALANFYKGLNFYNQDTIIENYATIINYIGKIYFYQENYNRALTYFNEVQLLYKRESNIKEMGMAHFESAGTNIKLNKFDTAHYHLCKAKEYFNTINYNNGLISVNLELSNLYNLTEKPDSTIVYIKKATPFLSENNIGIFGFEYYKQYALYYTNINSIDSAIYFAFKAKKACAKNADIYTKIECRLLHAKIMSRAGKYKTAFIDQRQASYLKDSVNKFINSYKIKILQSELESNRKQVVINTLTSERKIQNQTIISNKTQLEKQRVLILRGIIGTLLLLGFTFLLAIFLRQKRKDNKILFIKNSRIAQQKEEIELQKQHLLDVNEELEKLSIIARETDNGIKIMNEVGRVTWVNEGYTKMHGYTLEDLGAIENIDLLGEQANINIQQLVNVWYGDKQPISFESLNKTKDGKEIWIQTTLNPILNEGGQIEKMISIDSDISLIKKAEKEILTKNRDITSSISYAKRIQEAMMTPHSNLTKHFKNSFCFYKPKAIVSGDFYWVTQLNNKMIVVCADSTGHGVPGAFMSMIGISFLNKIIIEKGFISPDVILNRMRMNIINHLHQDGSETAAGDGMDMSIITIDISTNNLEYAGAMSPFFIVRNNDIIELKPDRMPVGYFDNEKRSFSLKKLSLELNDQIYLFTDGYHDQFGGKTGSKMKSLRFKNILVKASTKPANEQKIFIENEFDKWKGNLPQIDDVLIMGIKIN